MIDPWFAAKGQGRSYAGLETSPLVDLPISIEDAISNIDAVLVSHLHADHWDEVAQRMIPHETLILCHERNANIIRTQGFKNVEAIGKNFDYGKVNIRTTGGRHGPPEVLNDMGEVSGFVFMATAEPTLYWAGDTILCDEVTETILHWSPKIVVVHGCAAMWKGAGPIVMNSAMIMELTSMFPSIKIIVTHLDAVDHATETRSMLNAVRSRNVAAAQRVFIPDDGEVLEFKLDG